MVVLSGLVTEEQVLRLKKIGLNEYEARAYLALVGLHEATAREILEAGSIPQGRVYDVLKNLANKGYIEIQSGTPTYYRAVDPANLVQNLGQEYMGMLKEVLDTFRNLYIDAPPTYPVWMISNETAIANRVFALLKTVEHELIVYTCNPDFFRPFVSDLRRVKKTSRLYLIVDDPKRFPFPGLEFRQANEEFRSIISDFTIDGTVYRNVFSMIIDGKESFDVMTINGRRIGMVTKLPIVHYIMRRWLSHLQLIDETG